MLACILACILACMAWMMSCIDVYDGRVLAWMMACVGVDDSCDGRVYGVCWRVFGGYYGVFIVDDGRVDVVMVVVMS